MLPCHDYSRPRERALTSWGATLEKRLAGTLWVEPFRHAAPRSVTNSSAVSVGVARLTSAGHGVSVRATRKPTRSLRKSEEPRLRLAARRFHGRPFQEPPRNTRRLQFPSTRALPSDGAPQ